MESCFSPGALLSPEIAGGKLMSDAEGRTTLGRPEVDDNPTGTGGRGERLGAPAPRTDAAPVRQISWLTESSPQAWDSYVSDGGPDYLVADCGSPESHELRLRALLQVPIKEGETLLEFGCGTGRLSDFVPTEVRYEGLDWSPEVIALARRRRPHGVFRCGSVSDLASHDWVVASGPFNYAKGWSKVRTAEAVSAMWEASRRGIAFNALCVPADGRLHYGVDELISFMEPCKWLNLELDRSYLPNDMCLRAWRTL